MGEGGRGGEAARGDAQETRNNLNTRGDLFVTQKRPPSDRVRSVRTVSGCRMRSLFEKWEFLPFWARWSGLEYVRSVVIFI